MYSFIITPGSIELPEKTPVVMNNNGRVQRDISTWLQSLILFHNREEASVSQKASRLTDWLNYLDRLSERVDLYEAQTLNLIDFANGLKERMAPSSANLYLMNICEFYWYAQDKEFTSFMIGWADMLAGRQKPLIQLENNTKGKGAKYKIPFLLDVTTSRQKYIPRRFEIDGLLSSLAQVSFDSSMEVSHDALAPRNTLIVRWLSEGCLRRQEVACLKKDSLPDCTGNEKKMISVEITDGTKFNKPRTIRVLPNLIIDTKEFFELDRPLIVDKYHEGKQDQGFVFISASYRSKDMSITPSSITDLITDVGDTKITPHALRRYGLSTYATALYLIEREMIKNNEHARVDEKVILLKLRNQAGHADFETTLKYYVEIARDQSILPEEQDKLSKMYLRQTELLNHLIAERLGMENLERLSG
ncbi:site-specific integrase [Shewanella sp. AC91-MNA-CIBAN-0169]|uniref:site-specific integrase n=1 Tax=Shewanella sp. AC91-MNA-CIBAN-0169 TaxID=3140466 RepID=UPI0033318E56